MSRWRLVAVLALAGAIVAVTALAARSSSADPKKAAVALARSLRGSGTKVVSRNGALWLGISKDYKPNRHRFRIYRWNGSAWTRVGNLVWRSRWDTPWPSAVSLTGSHDPDFATEGCGAGDNNCMSVISDIGGRWHLVPFEYGSGRTTEVNGLPSGRFVLTEFDACGCAMGPTTWMYERYVRGMFRPSAGPAPRPRCSRVDLEGALGVGAVPTLQFDHVACAGSWALAAGTGNRYDGPVVGLFNRNWALRGRGRLGTWRLITLDNGLSLPMDTRLYDLPPALLLQLERKLGKPFAPIVAATRLATRQGAGLQNLGLIRAQGAFRIVEIDHPHHEPFSAVIYRWNGSRWAVAGRIATDQRLVNFRWGWFVSVPSANGIVLELHSSSGPNPRPAPPGKFVITNAGGAWHVAPRR